MGTGFNRGKSNGKYRHVDKRNQSFSYPHTSSQPKIVGTVGGFVMLH